MTITENEYYSLVKLEGFLSGMVPKNHIPPHISALRKIIKAWEAENHPDNDKLEKASLTEPVVETFSDKKLYSIGDKSKAVCHKCDKIVTTTMKESTDKHWAIGGFCDICETMVSIPHQPMRKNNEPDNQSEKENIKP